MDWMRLVLHIALALAALSGAARAAPADGELVAQRPCVRPDIAYPITLPRR
jgi:hypothetical protein